MNEVSIFDPRTMGKVVDRMPPVRTFFRSTFFKTVNTFTTKSIDVDFRKGNRRIAPFVHRKIGGKTVPNSGYQTKTYTPPLVAPNKITTVDDLLNRSFGESLYNGKTPAERAVEKLARDFTELEEMIVRREEWMCAQAIYTGTIPVIGEGLNEVIDFKFTNFEAKATAADKWKADKIGYIKACRKQVQKTGFVNCNVCIMADNVVTDFLNDTKVQKLLDVKGYDLAVIKPQELPNGTTYVGSLRGEGIDIYTYNEWFLDDFTDPAAPEEKPLVPDGTLALLSTAANFSMDYAAVTVLDGKTENFVTVEGARVPTSWIERNPDRRFLQLNSNPLSVPHEVDSWFVAQVL